MRIERRCDCVECLSWRLARCLFLAAIAVVVLFAALHRNDGRDQVMIDEPDMVTPAAARGMIDLCETRELPGDRYTLNPHAPPDKRRQETVRVCIETLPDGRLPPRPPFKVIVQRKAWRIA